MARKKAKKPKAVKVQFLPRVLDSGVVAQPYRIMEMIVATERNDLAEARIGILWHYGWNEDRFGLLTLGKCQKLSDMNREISEYDFLIQLNAEVWGVLGDVDRERLVFHELMHAQLDFDVNDDAKRDERGRLICHLRKHDVSDFRAVIAKYGCDDLLARVEAAIADADRPLLDGIDAAAKRVSTNIAAQRDKEEADALLAAADAKAAAKKNPAAPERDGSAAPERRP